MSHPMMIDVVRVTNPAMLELEPIQKLLARAFKGNALMASYSDAPKAYSTLTSGPQTALFIGAEGGRLLGLAGVDLPHTPLAPAPIVYHFANFGSPRLRDALYKAVVDFVTANGYTRFLAANLTGKGDDAYIRAFRRWAVGEVVGSFLEFRVKDGEDQ